MIAMRDGTGLKYLLTDHLGSIVAVTAANGTLITQQRYLPFGGERTDVPSPQSAGTDYGYTGQRDLGDELGLMDYRARFFSPTLGRFIQPDSMIPNPVNPQSWNRYSYVMNRPVNFNDPSGHCPEEMAECRKILYDLLPKPKPSGGGKENSGKKQNDKTADLGNFQLLPASYDYLTYSSIAEAGYAGYWLSGAPAYGDRLLPGFTVTTEQVGAGALFSFPSVLVDWANMGAPYAQKLISPYDQSVSLDFSVRYYNIPRKDGFMVATVNDLLITNSSRQVMNYTVAISSPSNHNIVRSGVFSAAPNETVHASMPANFSFINVLNVAVHAFTGCTGPCIVSNPPPPSLAGYGNFSFSP